jgi:TRAP-type mannitol/chloroaromatic compound transport system permease small subunit
VAVTTLVVAAVIFKLSFAQVEHAFASLEGSTDPGGLPYRFLLKSFIPIGFALVALQAVGQGARCIVTLKAGARRG